MALPTLNKTWQFSVNNIVAGSATVLTSCQNLMFAIKNIMKAFGTSPWTVWGSNDGQGAGHFGNGDANDRWAASTNLIWAATGANHSWIVLQQGGLGGNAAICIDCRDASTNPYNCIITMSPSAGFGTANGGADGTAVAAPTASDSITVLSAAAWGGTASSILTRSLISAMQSTDGQCTRIFIFRKGGVCGTWVFDKAKSPISQWISPVFAYIKGDSADAPTDPDTASYANLYAANVKSYLTVACSGNFTGEGDSANLIGEIMTFADEDTLEWPIAAMGVYFSTIGHRGHRGEVFDMWWGSTARVTGDCYPGSGTTLQFIQIGDIILPWDQATALITTQGFYGRCRRRCNS